MGKRRLSNLSRYSFNELLLARENQRSMRTRPIVEAGHGLHESTTKPDPGYRFRGGRQYGGAAEAAAASTFTILQSAK
jgi:hypothetical protein